jgi:NAD-dependent SIR2 family protein deacetylase
MENMDNEVAGLRRLIDALERDISSNDHAIIDVHGEVSELRSQVKSWARALERQVSDLQSRVMELERQGADPVTRFPS